MEVREARSLFPATEKLTYLNTAAVGLASSALLDAYRGFIGEWSDGPLDYVRGEEAGERARGSVAALIGADPADVALIASVSAAAGLVTPCRARPQIPPERRAGCRVLLPLARGTGALRPRERRLEGRARAAGELLRPDDGALRRALADCGWAPLDLQEANRSAIVSVPLGDTDPAHVVSELRARGVVCSARDGHLRLTVHFYNHEDDIERAVRALS